MLCAMCGHGWTRLNAPLLATAGWRAVLRQAAVGAGLAPPTTVTRCNGVWGGVASGTA